MNGNNALPTSNTSSTKLPTILIIEPNLQLQVPYLHLAPYYTVDRVRVKHEALEKLTRHSYQAVSISATLEPLHSLDILDAIKNRSQRYLIDVFYVVDLTNRLNFIPGVHWAGAFGLLHSLSSAEEVTATLTRIRASETAE